MPTKPPSVRVYVSADVTTHEAMRFTLQEIVRRVEREFITADECADLAREVLGYVEQHEADANAE